MKFTGRGRDAEAGPYQIRNGMGNSSIWALNTILGTAVRLRWTGSGLGDRLPVAECPHRAWRVSWVARARVYFAEVQAGAARSATIRSMASSLVRE